MTTSAGDPDEVHRPAEGRRGSPCSTSCRRCAAALKAVDAGVDGLVVEGGEGGGFKNPRDVATMVLLPLVCSKVDVPVIAAGGICDGRSMAAAFALGAEGVQMGTPHGVGGRVAGARELEGRDRRRRRDRHGVPQPLLAAGPAGAAHRAQRRGSSTKTTSAWIEFGTAMDLYFGGDMEASLALGGQVVGRIDEVKPVARIIEETMREFRGGRSIDGEPRRRRAHRFLTRPFRALNASPMLTTPTTKIASSACAMSPHAQPTTSNDRSPARI